MLSSSVENRRPETIDPARAWEPYAPSEQSPWTLAQVGHLYRRAAFGGTHVEHEAALRDGPQQAIDRLFTPEGDVEEFEREYAVYEKAASGNLQSMQAWWLRRMLESPDPLREKLTLFWHEHFASGPHRDDVSVLMFDNVVLLRRHALGSLHDMLDQLLLDPAFLLSRDAAENRKAAPNDRFAAELLRRTLGENAVYAESDIHETARALTGTFVYADQTRFIPREYDGGEKTILGTAGPHDADRAARILLEHSDTSLNIVRKLYRSFVAEDERPSDELIQPLATQFAIDFDIRGLAERMLRSNLFFSPTAYRRRVKSPVEFAVGLIRAMEERVSTLELAKELPYLGQEIYNPPTLDGWPHGAQWLNAATVIGRDNLAFNILSGVKRFSSKIDPEALASRHGGTDRDAAATFFADLLIQSDVEQQTIAELKTATLGAHTPDDRTDIEPDGLVAFVHGLASLPEYQLA